MEEVLFGSIGPEIIGTKMPTKNTLLGGAKGKGSRFYVSREHKVRRSGFMNLLMVQIIKSKKTPIISSGLWCIGIRTKTTKKRKTMDGRKLDIILPGVDSDACTCFVRDTLERSGIIDNDARMVMTISSSQIWQENRIDWILCGYNQRGVVAELLPTDTAIEDIANILKVKF